MAAKRKSAFSAAMKEAQQQHSDAEIPYYGETVQPSESDTETLQYRETVERLYSNTVTRQDGKASEEFEKTTFYLTAEQVEKLDDLAHDHKKRTGQRINRNDIVRHLIDQATLDSLDGIKRHVRKVASVIPTQDRPDIDERFRTDTQVHYFKKWIRNHDQPQGTDFFKRFLVDSHLPQHASRSLYEAKMRTAGY